MKPCLMNHLLACVFCLTSPIGAGTLRAQDSVAGIPYEKLDTRSATEARMLALLLPGHPEWGEWYSLASFPYAGHGKDDLKTPHAPENELVAMVPGGPGPNLGRSYVGKNEHSASWQKRGLMYGHSLDFAGEDSELNNNVVAYFYTTVTVDQKRSVDFSCGSDDGLRLWVNARLVIDKDVPRGLNATDDTVTLSLEEGVNHVFGKVSQGGGGWAFKALETGGLSSDRAVMLQYMLDRDYPPDRVREHYRVLPFALPKSVVLEVGGLDFFANGDPVVATRRGEVFRIEGAYAEPPTNARFRLFAEGLHEPLGLGVRTEANGVEAVYSVQRSELTRMSDTDGDGRADVYASVFDGWGVSGNYHEFAFGPEFDDAGDMWVTLNVGFCGSLGKAVVPYRGWALKIDAQGKATLICDGMRSPNGIGRFSDGSMFYVDNQGDYVATNRLSHLAPGSWHGHPASLRWRENQTEPGARPPRQEASIWFPYNKMGRSAADIALDSTGGKFGPFEGQFFVGDQADAEIMRVYLEQVEGHYQGACFPFIDKLQSGVNRVAFAPDGSLFVGETDRGWGSLGGQPYGFERIVYTGDMPFEIRSMRALADGFELEFTEDVDPDTLVNPASYSIASYTYEYHASYGAPEDDKSEERILACEALGPRRVRLRLDRMRQGYVHELLAQGVRSVEGEALLHADAYYTLIRVPGRSVVAEVEDAALPQVLFLTHSAGYEHGVIKRPDPFVLSHAEEKLTEAARGRYRILASKDCANLAPQKLQEFAAVIFYTTGELPVSSEVAAGFVDWVAKGGAFVGVHCATDTFYEFAPYMDMIGGAFDGHPWHEEVTVKVEDASHPATEHLGGSFRITDEIYQFRNFEREGLQVLLSLDHASVDIDKGKRTDRDYALAWSRSFGKGRLFYTALGHRPEVWEDGRFMEHLLDGIDWSMGNVR